MAALVAVMGFLSVRGFSVHSLALEQEVRCGIPAHTHGTACYDGHRRVCGMEEHQHSRNCYIILLEENDINDLLVQMSALESNSLEGVITQTVDNALVYNVNLTSPLSEGATLEDVAELNRTVTEHNVQPAVVFNENIQTTNAISSDTMGASLPSTGGISTLALGEDTTTEQGWANYYVYLDGQWTTVGKLQFSTNYSNNRYSATESSSEIASLYNNTLGLTTISSNNLTLYYASSPQAAQWSAASRSGNNRVFGSSYYSRESAQATKYVRLMSNANTPRAFYTVTFVYADGTSTSQIVASGNRVTLPRNYTWAIGDTQYSGGTTQTITATTTFREYVEDPRLQIVYDVNFPAVSDVSVSTRPTLQGLAQTTVSDPVEEGEDSRIRSVSQQEVKASINNSSTGQHRMIRFIGWRVGNSDVTLSPNATLTYDELVSLVGSGRKLQLTGVWEYHAKQTVSLFVRYDSVAVDTNGNITGQDSNNYTDEIFSAFVMGVDTDSSSTTLTNQYGVADVSADNSYTADQEIRALYGQKAEGVWLTSFPDDNYIFEQLKSDSGTATGNLKVDGETVRVEDLNDNVYTIRWYVFKCQDDAWHVDGRLVRKEGLLDVSKTFAGNAEAIAAAKEDFHITLRRTDTGQTVYLYLNEPSVPPAGGEVLLPTSASGDTYTWRVSGLRYGDPWQAVECIHEVDHVVRHNDWRIVDTYGGQSSVGTGDTVDFMSSTVATDMDVWYPLAINFTNIYHNTDSIIIKKEDAATGSPLGGAVFRLIQNGTVMTFTYDTAANVYRYDPDGTVTELSGSTSGYYELNIQDFSYEDGSVEVQELQAPQGYTPIENIVIGYRQQPQMLLMAAPPPDLPVTEDTGQTGPAAPVEEPAEATATDLIMVTASAPAVMAAQTETPEVELLSSSPMASYSNGLLIIRNSTENTSVTVNKQWLCPAEDWREVTIQLMANDAPVTSLISGVELTKVLNEGNGWQATWDDLPLYANGAEIVWSVREVKIGSEKCLSDYSFVNYLVSYSAATYTYDSEGRLANTAFTVTNDTYRTLLRLVKTNLGGGIRLEGAVFRLERLIDGEADGDFLVRTITTGADGTITFDNLMYGDYRLTEVQPPDGYEEMDEPVYLTIQSSGSVAVQPHPYAQAGTTAYTIHVLNQQQRPLPSTGGSGTTPFYLAGLLLIAGALINLSLRERCRTKVRRRGL